MDTTEGRVNFHVATLGKQLQIWYKIVGDITSGRPLVVLHGGPGLSHNYMLGLTALATPDRPLVFWDQLGTGQSSHLQETFRDYTFWTEQFFLDQVSAILMHLNIGHNYDLHQTFVGWNARCSLCCWSLRWTSTSCAVFDAIQL